MMKKFLASLMACTVLLALASCGKAPVDAPDATTQTAETTTTLALPEPAALVNPEDDIDWGWNDYTEEKFQDETSDIWYPATIGKNDSNYMYFHNGHGAYQVIGGEEKSAGWILNDAMHMVPDPEYAEFDFDIVFMDRFTMYDYITKTYYTRGDQVRYEQKLIGKTYTCKTDAGRTILLNEDGTAAFSYNGQTESCTWKVMAQRVISVAFEDGYDKNYYIFYNEDGSVQCLSEKPTSWTTPSSPPKPK